MVAEAPTSVSTFAFMMELGATEICGGSLGFLEQLICQSGWGVEQEMAVDDCFLCSNRS